MVRKCVPILLPSTIHHVCNKLEKKRRNMLFIIEIFDVLFNFDSILAQRKRLELKVARLDFFRAIPLKFEP